MCSTHPGSVCVTRTWRVGGGVGVATYVADDENAVVTEFLPHRSDRPESGLGQLTVT